MKYELITVFALGLSIMPDAYGQVLESESPIGRVEVTPIDDGSLNGHPGVCDALLAPPTDDAFQYSAKVEQLAEQYKELFENRDSKFNSIPINDAALLAEAATYNQNRESLKQSYVMELNELRKAAGLKLLELSGSSTPGIGNRGPGGSLCDLLNTSEETYVQVCDTCQIAFYSEVSRDCDGSLYVRETGSKEWACFSYRPLRGYNFRHRPVLVRTYAQSASSQSFCGICPTCRDGWGQVYIPAFETSSREEHFESCSTCKHYEREIIIEHKVFKDSANIYVDRAPSCTESATYSSVDTPPTTYPSFCGNAGGNDYQCAGPADYYPPRY